MPVSIFCWDLGLAFKDSITHLRCVLCFITGVLEKQKAFETFVDWFQFVDIGPTLKACRPTGVLQQENKWLG